MFKTNEVHSHPMGGQNIEVSNRVNMGHTSPEDIQLCDTDPSNPQKFPIPKRFRHQACRN